MNITADASNPARDTTLSLRLREANNTGEKYLVQLGRFMLNNADEFPLYEPPTENNTSINDIKKHIYCWAMNKIGIRNIEVEIPSKWSEIDKRNLLYLATKFPFQKLGFALYFSFTYLIYQKKPLLAFCNSTQFYFIKEIKFSMEKRSSYGIWRRKHFETQILIALHQLDNFEWLHTDIQFEKCLIDKFSVNLKKFYGPREYLSNVTSDEFRHAEFFFINYYKTSDIYFLDRLIATLWRRKKFC